MEYIKIIFDNLPKYLSSGKLQCRENFKHPNRTLDSFTFICGLLGTLYISEDDNNYTVSKNETLILEPNKNHFSYKDTENISYYWAHFKLDNLKSFEVISYEEASSIYFMIYKKAYSDIQNIILIPKKFSLTTFEKIRIIIHQLIDSSCEKYYTKSITNSILLTLLLEITNQAMIHHVTKHVTNESYRFYEIIEWIRINKGKPLTASWVAREFNYNTNYLSNLFKQKTGYSLIKFINKTKISKAKEMILDTERTIKSIAYDLGFKDEKYFYKLFKQYTNLTPTEFKNSISKIHMNIK